MTSSERNLRAALDATHEPPFDAYLLVISTAICVVFGLAALPAAASEPFEANVPLLILTAIAYLLAGVQWLALMRKFGYEPPIVAALVGIAACLLFAAYHGQLGALVGLAIGVVVSFGWRTIQDSPTRLADAAYAVSAVALLGFLPAQGLLLRQLPFGATGYYMFIVGVLVFGIVQGVLSRPERDGTRALGNSTVLALIATVIVICVFGIVAGDPFGFFGGLVIGACVGGGALLGRALLPLLTPAPTQHGRVVKRRPMLIDVLLPFAIAAAAAFFCVRSVITP